MSAERSRHARLAAVAALATQLLLSACTAQRGSASAANAPKPGVSASGEAETGEADSETPATPAASDEAASDEARGEVLDDSGDVEEPAPHETQPSAPHPLDGWSDAKIAAAIAHDLPSLGSMSLGTANAGALINGVQASETPFYKPVSPSGSWATQETLAFLERALGKVHQQFPDTQQLALGDISTKNGGPARPHISHQSGRDVDIGYFYNDGSRWYARGTAQNLDLARDWAFVRALITDTDVDLILIDHSIQLLLEQYALEHGEDPSWLSGIFRGAPGQLRPIIRHAPGHATHLHIRFFNPIAQETARRCQALLIQAKLTRTPQSYVSHQVKKNETLGMISRKYGVSVPRLRAENGLRSSRIREKSVLRVPVAGRGPERAMERPRLPARRQPPPTK